MTRPSARRFRGDGHASERGESNGGPAPLLRGHVPGMGRRTADCCPLPSRPRHRRRPGRCWSSRESPRRHSRGRVPAPRLLHRAPRPPGTTCRPSSALPRCPIPASSGRRGPTPPRRRAGSTSPWSWTRSPTRSCPTPPRTRPTPRREAPPPVRRGPRFFGRFAPPSAFAGRGSRTTRGADPDEPKSKAKSDPAADAELKRRIERQVREALGDRVRSVEVRVVGRNVAIRAEASRFWQRRSVRRTLESLPGLAGYRTTIDVGD